nr:hypothetical protein Iba_chr11cCG9570 [Ipomoea batatas]
MDKKQSSNVNAKKTPTKREKVIVQNSPEDDLEESEQPASGSEPDVNRQNDKESLQPSARSEPDVNNQEVEGSEDSQPDEDRNTDTKYSDATYPSLSTRATIPTYTSFKRREKNEISSSGFGYCYIDEPQQPLKAIKDKKSGESEEGRVADFIATFDEIDNAIARGEQYRTKIAEEPSFGLGMTPDENVMNDEFITSTGPSIETTPNLTQQTTTEDQTQHEQHPIEMQTEQTAAKEPQGPEPRVERRQVKATNPLKSPYLTRQIDMKRPWTTTENIIGEWILQNENVDP